MSPDSFDEDEMTEWSVWVLDNGLPDLPPTVMVGESVPVARWVGKLFAAVVHVQWSWTDDHAEDELQSEVEVFRRDPEGSGWEVASGSGGGGWFSPPLQRPQIPPDHAGLVHFVGHGDSDWYCCAAYGLAGAEARYIEVADYQGVTRCPIESPLGVFVVAADGTRDAVARVLTADRALLMEQGFSPWTSW